MVVEDKQVTILWAHGNSRRIHIFQIEREMGVTAQFAFSGPELMAHQQDYNGFREANFSLYSLCILFVNVEDLLTLITV